MRGAGKCEGGGSSRISTQPLRKKYLTTFDWLWAAGLKVHAIHRMRWHLVVGYCLEVDSKLQHACRNVAVYC